MRITVCGAYGGGNVGDEATLSVLLEDLRKAAPDADLLVFSYDPAETMSMHRVKSSRPSLLAIAKTDILVIEDLDSFFKFFLGFLGKVLRKKVLYYAVGVPKLSLPMKLIIPLAMNVDEVYVRDLYSKRILERCGLRRNIKVIPDPALRLKPIDRLEARQILEKENISTDGFLVGLSLRYSRNEELDRKVKETMSQLINWLIEEKHAEIVFIPMCKHKLVKMDRDDLFGEELKKMINVPKQFKVLTGLNSPREVKGIFMMMNICIGMRLHSAVFAHSVCIPYIGLVTGWAGYDEKIVAFMRDFFGESPLNINHIDVQALKHKVVQLSGARFPVHLRLRKIARGLPEQE